jgi:hypothetical protein
MNYLQLSQRLAQEVGVSGALTATVGQVGSLLRIVTWINQAWYELQTKHDDWSWMKSSYLLGGGVSFATVAGQASYPLGTGVGTVGVTAANFGKWVEDSFRNYATAASYTNEIFMDPITFESWRNSYMYGAMRNVKTRPVAAAIGPDKSVCVGPPSDGSWTVTGDYFIAPSQMAADIDVPTGLPLQYHMAIVYLAMQMYAGYESASEVFQRGEAGYNKALAELERQYAPRIGFAGSLC